MDSIGDTVHSTATPPCTLVLMFFHEVVRVIYAHRVEVISRLDPSNIVARQSTNRPTSRYEVFTTTWPSFYNFILGHESHDETVAFVSTTQVSCKRSMTCWPSPTTSAYLRCYTLIGPYLLCCFVQGSERCAVLGADARRQYITRACV